MPAYVVAQIGIEDPEGYREYLAGFMPIFSKYDGKLLATTKNETIVVEGTWVFPKTVIMEFPNLESAKSWLADPEYQELSKVRKRTAKTNLAIVEGVP